MSLIILSSVVSVQEEVFANVMIAVLRAKLFCAVNESALQNNGAINDIDIRRYFGNKEDDYDYFLMDIQDMEWSMKMFEQGTFKKNTKTYYSLVGTDNTPSKLCYDFSLAYLRLCPEHLISIYEWVFSLKDIERLAQTKGWYETWYQDFDKLDVSL